MSPETKSEQVEAEQLASAFEERAENLSKKELTDWTASTPRDQLILSKLKGPGAKLLSGPRGSGKSTLIKRAYFELLEEGKALAVYVNYARSLALEPLFHRRADALHIFRQWVLYKVVDGVASSFEEVELQPPRDLKRLAKMARSYIHALEAGAAPPETEVALGPSRLLSLLDEWAAARGARRTVLLLDDAAHAFSPDQMREFFEIFRELRSRTVSAKAAVYPGITAYSPYFQVGHEAELIEAWYQVDSPEYLAMMHDIVKRRIPDELALKLVGKEELVDYIALACFGLPRGFLVMLSQLLGLEEDSAAKPSRAVADKAINRHVTTVRGVFSSLKSKLPRYRNFVTVGEDLEAECLNALRSFNREKPLGGKATTVAFPEPLENELESILELLQYAGLVRAAGTVSRGVKGRFRRYVIHYASLLDSNSLSLGKAYPVGDAVSSLSKTNAHAFVRTRGASLLGDDFQARCTLDLEPCQSCGTPRAFAEAKFCSRCGGQLTDASVYEQLVRAPLRRLPLTKLKLEKILAHSQMRVVQDILLDEDTTILRSIPSIGPIWAGRIRGYAEEFVSV